MKSGDTTAYLATLKRKLSLLQVESALHSSIKSIWPFCSPQKSAQCPRITTGTRIRHKYRHDRLIVGNEPATSTVIQSRMRRCLPRTAIRLITMQWSACDTTRLSRVNSCGLNSVTQVTTDRFGWRNFNLLLTLKKKRGSLRIRQGKLHLISKTSAA
jgi:hypothetical protein